MGCEEQCDARKVYWTIKMGGETEYTRHCQIRMFFNLIFISRHTKTVNCSVTFFAESCLIRDGSLRMIGSGNLFHGLYYLNLEPEHNLSNVVCENSIVAKSVLWYFKLGHVSLAQMNTLCKDFPSVHKHLSFTVHTSIVVHPFDLLHMDVRGPYANPLVHNHRFFITIVDDHNRFTWIIMLKGKYEVKLKFKDL
ncbi:hypothetical protein CR513_49437, partial [Mucuna pruriens]